jgi:hypothetical protein
MHILFWVMNVLFLASAVMAVALARMGRKEE